MGVDMNALNPRVATPAGFQPLKRGWRDNDPWYFCLNWSGMAKMVDELDREGIIDTDALEPEWPKIDHDKHLTERGDRNEFGDYYDAKTPDGKRYLDTTRAIRAGVTEHGKVPFYKFGTNDGWIITPPECIWIADALEERLLILPEGERWTGIVAEFAAYNRRCAERADGYTVY